jgi:hypothetical protein
LIANSAAGGIAGTAAEVASGSGVVKLSDAATASRVTAAAAEVFGMAAATWVGAAA